MRSPFYNPSLLYPNRTTAETPEQIAKVLPTIKDANKIPIKTLILNYFPHANQWNILTAFELLKTN